MRKDIPEGVLPMLSIPGLRPDKVLKVHRELGVASLDELEQAARQDPNAVKCSRTCQGYLCSRPIVVASTA